MSRPTSDSSEPTAQGGATAAPALEPIRGILLLSCAVLLFACMDTTLKYLTTRFEVPLIVAVRYSVNCLLMIVFLAPSYGMRLVQTQRTGLVVLRAGCLAAASILFASALKRMPIAESTSVIFLAPVMVVLLARPVLGERIGVIGAIAALAGFTGVLLIARPGADLDPLGVALALAAASVNAVYQLLSRILASSERTMALLFYSALVGTLAYGSVTPWFLGGRAPDAIELVLLLSLGLYSGIGHYLFTAAHRYAHASTLAPVGFLQLPYVGLLGWLVFGDVPPALSIAGIIVIIGAGALITLKPSLERRRRLNP